MKDEQELYWQEYIGNNRFEGGIDYPVATFELQKDGTVKVFIQRTAEKKLYGTKILKYR